MKNEMKISIAHFAFPPSRGMERRGVPVVPGHPRTVAVWRVTNVLFSVLYFFGIGVLGVCGAMAFVLCFWKATQHAAEWTIHLLLSASSSFGC